MIWKAKEGREVFTFKANNLHEAEMACEMWNATLLGRVGGNGFLVPEGEDDL